MISAGIGWHIYYYYNLFYEFESNRMRAQYELDANLNPNKLMNLQIFRRTYEENEKCIEIKVLLMFSTRCNLVESYCKKVSRIIQLVAVTLP